MAIATVTIIAGGEKISCPAGESVESTFHVTNTSGKKARFSLEPHVETPAKSPWFELTDEIERDFSEGGGDQVRVQVRIPEDTPQGRYTFSLRAYLTEDPEQFADSPKVAVEVPAATKPAPAPTPKPSGFRWWPIAVAAAVVIVLVAGGVTYILLRPEPGAPPLVWNTANWDEATWQ